MPKLCLSTFYVLYAAVQVDKIIGAIRGCPTISGVICIDQNTFALCNTDGYLTEGHYNCAIGAVCTESSSEICKPILQIVPPLCDKNCGRCSKNRRFACVGRSKFALCSDGNYPGGMVYSCPKNTVCSTARDGIKEDGTTKVTEFCYDELLMNKTDCC